MPSRMSPTMIMKMSAVMPAISIGVRIVGVGRHIDGLLMIVLRRDDPCDGAEHGSKNSERDSLIARPPPGRSGLQAHCGQRDECSSCGRDRALCQAAHGLPLLIVPLPSSGVGQSTTRTWRSCVERDLYFRNVDQQLFRKAGYTNIQKLAEHVFCRPCWSVLRMETDRIQLQGS